MRRQMHFEHIKAAHPGKEIKFGQMPFPDFYAVMKVEGGYQFLSDEGVDGGITPNRFECRQWAIWNDEHRKEQSEKWAK